jgi:oxygen-dependent protoporphyrinogen oxidase
VYLGGFRNPRLPFLNADEQLKLVLADLKKTLGITGAPTFHHQVTHAKAIPQYEIGYANIRKQIEQVELENPGLYLGGNYRGGVSLSDSIINGLNFADQITARLKCNGKIAPEMAKSPTLE